MDHRSRARALDYDKVDYWGGSYGRRRCRGLRHTIRPSPAFDRAGRTRRHAGIASLSPGWRHRPCNTGVVRLDCERSPTCSPESRQPEAELRRLIEPCATGPCNGAAPDASGNVRAGDARLKHVAADRRVSDRQLREHRRAPRCGCIVPAGRPAAARAAGCGGFAAGARTMATPRRGRRATTSRQCASTLSANPRTPSSLRAPSRLCTHHFAPFSRKAASG
jgi:hypothetical protein